MTNYVREQKGHSLLMALFVVGPITLYALPIYWAMSPNHFFHM